MGGVGDHRGSMVDVNPSEGLPNQASVLGGVAKNPSINWPRRDRQKRNFSLGVAGMCCNQGCTKNDIGRLCWVRLGQNRDGGGGHWLREITLYRTENVALILLPVQGEESSAFSLCCWTGCETAVLSLHFSVPRQSQGLGCWWGHFKMALYTFLYNVKGK